MRELASWNVGKLSLFTTVTNRPSSEDLPFTSSYKVGYSRALKVEHSQESVAGDYQARTQSVSVRGLWINSLMRWRNLVAYTPSITL